MFNSFMLVITVWASDGTSRDDLALGFGLSWGDCVEMAYILEGGLNDERAQVFCELEGVSQ
jgi:hypothetical protein